jgi:putative salt-induced outer membrane protein
MAKNLVGSIAMALDILPPLRRTVPVGALIALCFAPFQSAAQDLPPPPLPPAARAMLEQAIAGGDEADIAAVAKIAKKTYPRSSAEISALVNARSEKVAERRKDLIQSASIFELWKGRGELGGFRSTGSTSEVGISAGLAITRTGLKWTHKLSASADYRRAYGATSRERIVAAYEPRYQFDPKGFAYGLTQFERDPIIGFDARYTGSAGIGYKLLDDKKLTLSVDAGPSLRHVAYPDNSTETKAGVRSSIDFAWKLNPQLTLRQTASGYVESNNESATALTALDARIIARLSARFSYNLQYESQNRLTSERFDTLSKVTLIYDF